MLIPSPFPLFLSGLRKGRRYAGDQSLVAFIFSPQIIIPGAFSPFSSLPPLVLYDFLVEDVENNNSVSMPIFQSPRHYAGALTRAFHPVQRQFSH